ncbi:Formamidopyrimidine-DNA glycosylase N-terminal domain-containing protein [Talaromyces proteolyticus]|uniref:Formamidopyrimidine-DNA glycosylase N-terminal domain-containing protein n=1 Tax=Talaromyces proteolyticus TaxID=1131652 RepID=A0AAD4KRA6_9EURO|nr:Formamidopyrimidine-DNA glycosylase N-terminal domain-containing protein [Talaromyces proteolyticus]KAH8697550.1 Formamidopyrimidine-DNA glycosylase N-terminal domain-containing protein [Talaromyces proteolyticus]
MPELAEVARIVHFIRKHLVDKTLSVVQTQNDDIVYGKVGTTAAEVQKALQGNKVTGAGQQGKYFWITLSKPPHLVMHFGMAGWLKIKNADTYYYRVTKPEDQEWPPKYWKFLLETDETPKTEAAFVDFRRLSRIRLVDCPADDIRQYTPLKENGPDPLADKNIFTAEWLVDKVKSKKVPIKAMLLDQANISGIGNWMGDEVLYHAKIHPEQYSNTLSNEQIIQLHKSIEYVCTASVDVLADSEKFPEDWLFKHRWGKGKKNQASVLPNGDKIVFLTVGGRTSAVVPAVQKKTGPVAKDITEEDQLDTKKEASTNGKRKRTSVKKEEEEDDDDDYSKTPKRAVSKKRASNIKKEDATPVKEEKSSSASQAGRRRSTRNSK